jgi:hypothetical protein
MVLFKFGYHLIDNLLGGAGFLIMLRDVRRLKKPRGRFRIHYDKFKTTVRHLFYARQKKDTQGKSQMKQHSNPLT